MKQRRAYHRAGTGATEGHLATLHPHARRSAPDGPPELDGTLAHALEVLRDRLRRDADRETRHAIMAEVYALAGYKTSEVRERLGISAEEMRLVVTRLKRALRNLAE